MASKWLAVAAVLLLAALAAPAAAKDKAPGSASGALSPASDEPCTLVLHLVLDCSGSMNTAERASQASAVTNAVAAVRASRPNSKIYYVLYTFGREANFGITTSGAAFQGNSAAALAGAGGANSAQIDPLEVLTPPTAFDTAVGVTSGITRSTSDTCHSCALDLALANMRRLKTSGTWSTVGHAVLMITDGVTNHYSTNPIATTAADIRALGVLGIIFVGTNAPADLAALVTVDPNNSTNSMFDVSANFNNVADKLIQMLELACDEPNVPRTKEVCDPLFITVLFDLSKSMLDAHGLAVAPSYRSFVEKVAPRFDPAHTKLGVFGFAGSTYEIAGYGEPSAAVSAMEGFHLGLTNRHDLPGVTPAQRASIIRSQQVALNRGTTVNPAAQIPYAAGLKRVLGSAPAPAKVDQYQPLVTKTLHAAAVRLVSAELKAKAPPDAKLMLLLVTDGGAYEHTTKCKNAFDQMEKALLTHLPRGTTLEKATTEQRVDAHAKLMCYETLTGDREFTQAFVNSKRAACPGLALEYAASTCCEADAPAQCDLKGALEEAKLPTAVTFLGDVWFADTTVDRVKQANLANGYGDGVTAVPIHHINDLSKAAVASVGEGPMIRHCRQVPVTD